MFELSIQTSFSAAHRLINYQGDCARCHGHNWQVTVLLQSEELNELGICVDFREIKLRVEKSIEELDHRELNQHPAFQNLNPTSEILARYLYHQLQTSFADMPATVSKVTVAENTTTSAAYYE